MEAVPTDEPMKLRDQIIKVLWITLAWVFVALFQFLIGLNIIIDLDLAEHAPIDPIAGIRGSIFSGLLAGLMGGTVLVFLWERWLRTKPYGWALRNIFLSYTVIWVFVSIPSTMFFYSKLNGWSFFDRRAFDMALSNLANLQVLIPYTTWLIVVIITMIAFLVNDKYGPGVFGKFLLGKYFNPSREERVFMFLDLRSSTATAEQLGEEKYFNFLRDVYREATPAILRFKGEIYQYVGDEIVVSWSVNSGIVNANCLQCYYEIRKLISRKRLYFESTYGVIPEFKAGLHHGPVMAGEIGVVKRDIAFSGDVLNTASRIQGKCNELGVDILLSKSLMDRLKDTDYSPREIGEIELRGKKEKVALFTI